MADPVHRQPIAKQDLKQVVADVLEATPAIDIHTHLYSPGFGQLVSKGIDDLLTYHYLEAELFRFSKIQPEKYWSLSKTERADLIWQSLFVDNLPLSEATRGVIAVLDALGLDTESPSVAPLRAYFRAQPWPDHVTRVFSLAGIASVVMTNDPLLPEEAAIWNNGFEADPRFHAALRLDRLLNEWPQANREMAAQGYKVDANGAANTMHEVRRFVEEWSHKMGAVYMAVSLPDTFAYPADDIRTRLLREAILPSLRDLDVPLALMIGARRQVNPALRDAGDAAGHADMQGLERLCGQYPENRFLVTVLSRENQHELCVYSRKFANLMPFGCWWFLNNPSIVEEVTRERFEMLGVSFIPQHSDARVLEQLIYKWRNTRRTLGPALTERFLLLAEDGRAITRCDVQRTVEKLMRGNFEGWTDHSRAGRIST